jgi:predicted DNA binding protein
MRQVTLRVRHHGEPESDVSAAHPAVTLRSISSLTGRGDERKRIVEVRGDPGAIPRFLDDFRAADPILDVEALSPLGARRVHVAATFDAAAWDSIAGRLADLGVHHRTGTEISAGWECWTVYLGADDDLAAVVDALADGGNDVELAREVELDAADPRPQLDATRVTEALTARQREVLATAIELGYYGVDGDADLAAVADADGTHVSTAWEHLARAEASVMEAVGAMLVAGRDPER